MINRYALNLWGYSRDQILGEPITSLLSKPYSEIIQKYSNRNILSDKLNSLNKNIEIYGVKENKEKFPLSLNFVENKIENEIFYTVAITDLTSIVRNKDIQNCILKISNSVRVSTNIKELYKDIFENLRILIPTQNFTISLLVDDNYIEEYNYSTKKDVSSNR